MKMVGYYAWHTFINSIKKIFRSKVMIVIALIIGFGVMFGLAAGIITSVVAPEDDTEISTEYESETTESSTEEAFNVGFSIGSEEESIDDDATIKTLVESGIFVLFIGFVLWGLYTGTKNGSNIFLMADVNLLFTAPLKPQSILMFRLTFQMAATILGSVYLLFQIPNLMNAGLNGFAIGAIFLAWIFLLIFQKLISVFSYTLTSTHESLKKYIKPLVYVVILILVAIVGMRYLNNGRDVTATLEIFGDKSLRMIPIIGWYKGLIMSAVDGQIGTSLMYAGLMLLAMAVLFYLIWQLKADFYEDALAGATTREEIAVAAKEGRKVKGKERSKRIKRNSEMKGFGGNVFFWKEVYNRRRFAKFGIFTNTMLTYIGTSVIISLFCIKAIETNAFAAVGAVIAGIAFFRNYGNPIAQETSKNWLFLTPDSPYHKVFAAIAAGSYACAMDILPAFVIAAILMPTNPLEVILWYVMIVTMDFMMSNVGMLLETIFPASALDVVKSMIQMFLKFFVAFVVVIILIVGYLLSGIVIALAVTAIMDIVIGLLIFLIYPTMLHDGHA